MPTISMSMPQELIDKLNRLQRYKRSSRSKVVQDALYAVKEPKQKAGK